MTAWDQPESASDALDRLVETLKKKLCAANDSGMVYDLSGRNMVQFLMRILCHRNFEGKYYAGVINQWMLSFAASRSNVDHDSRQWFTPEHAAKQGWSLDEGLAVPVKLINPLGGGQGRATTTVQLGDVGYGSKHTVIQRGAFGGYERKPVTPSEFASRVRALYRELGVVWTPNIWGEGLAQRDGVLGFYHPTEDAIWLSPPVDDGRDLVQWCLTALHELVHWTRAPARLGHRLSPSFDSNEADGFRAAEPLLARSVQQRKEISLARAIEDLGACASWPAGIGFGWGEEAEAAQALATAAQEWLGSFRKKTGKRFASARFASYQLEEVVADFGSIVLCACLGFEPTDDLIEASANYAFAYTGSRIGTRLSDSDLRAVLLQIKGTVDWVARMAPRSFGQSPDFNEDAGSEPGAAAMWALTNDWLDTRDLTLRRPRSPIQSRPAANATGAPTLFPQAPTELFVPRELNELLKCLVEELDVPDGYGPSPGPWLSYLWEVLWCDTGRGVEYRPTVLCSATTGTSREQQQLIPDTASRELGSRLVSEVGWSSTSSRHAAQLLDAKRIIDDSRTLQKTRSLPGKDALLKSLWANSGGDQIPWLLAAATVAAATGRETSDIIDSDAVSTREWTWPPTRRQQALLHRLEEVSNAQQMDPSGGKRILLPAIRLYPWTPQGIEPWSAIASLLPLTPHLLQSLLAACSRLDERRRHAHPTRAIRPSVPKMLRRAFVAELSRATSYSTYAAQLSSVVRFPRGLGERLRLTTVGDVLGPQVDVVGQEAIYWLSAASSDLDRSRRKSFLVSLWASTLMSAHRVGRTRIRVSALLRDRLPDGSADLGPYGNEYIKSATLDLGPMVPIAGFETKPDQWNTTADKLNFSVEWSDG